MSLKSCQILRQTDSPPFTMSLDDQLARLKSMNSDLQQLVKDLDRIIKERDELRRECAALRAALNRAGERA